MEEWKEYTLSNLGTIVGGATPSTKDSSNYENGSIAWITPKDLSTHTERFISHGERNITEKGLKSCSAQLMPPNSILFTSRAPIGYIAIAKNEVCTNQGFKSIVPNKDTDFMFLYYLLRYNKDNIENLGSGTTFKEVSGSTMRNVPVKVPPLPTQQKIAAILSSLDDKIELNNKINTNLEQQAQALFDEMFKDDKKDILLGEVIETTSGGTPSRKNISFYSNGNNCWVKSKELESGFIIDTEEKITDDAINNSAAKLLPENSVLIAMYGATVGAYGIISKPMTCNQAICALLPTENYPYTYLFMFAKNVTQELENLAVGSAQQNISQVLIKKLKVHSDTNKIKEFHSSTHALFEQMLLIRQGNKNLSELRDSLLPKLMNGEIETNSNIISKE